ncbi:MAG: pyridoxal phosphate-dependent aminotransferase [Proteobacteria bacterium]|nr:pyridoxal phosphate-dependent aminotransferase [Pseudomonadota bacterium]
MNFTNTIDDHIRSGTESETLLINQISLQRTRNNEEVFKFGFGQSPFPIPKKISDSLANAAHRKEYMSVQGYLPLRQMIVTFHHKMQGKNWHEDSIIIGTGSKILIFSIMAAFENVEIILPAPSWVSYEPQAKLMQHQVHWIATNFADKWSLTPELLDKYCNHRKNPKTPLILILNYPNNPTGQTFDTQQLQALAEVMKKHKVIVIADEIYSLLKFNGDQASIVDFYPEGCIVTSGLSKWCGAGGWRLGFTYIPPTLGKKLFQAVVAVASETYSCAPAPIQIAATTAYADVELASDFLAKQTKLLATINDYCCTRLSSAKVRIHPCVGGFYLFPDFSQFKQKLNSRQIHTSSQLTSAIMAETGVALLPGSAFGMQEDSLTARLAFVDFKGEQILSTSPKRASFEKVKQGINKLCAWLNNL